METEICHQINAELINKIISNLYSFSYTDEAPAEDKVILRYEDFKLTLELQMDLKKNDDGIINSCAITAAFTKENKKT